MSRITRIIGILLLGCMLAGCASNPGTVDETTLTESQPIMQTETLETNASTQPATEPEQPEPVEYVLSFVGDCCLANMKGWGENEYFMGTVGDDYSYPFANVQEYFAKDDCTFINLENPLTDATGSVNNDFVFKGPTAYTGILTAGSVEFASVVNNHAMDYRVPGYEDTIAALDSAGIYYAEQQNTIVFTTERGLTIGVYADMFPQNAEGMAEAIAAMRSAGAEIIIVCLHWGQEYYYKPNESQINVGRAAIDAGADIVYGHHSHILQPVEEYNGGIIFYSLGNFCFGGNTNPADKDSAILQQTVIREPDGTVHLGELIRIPCSISSVENYNNFQPTPMEPGTEAYERTLSKLDGTFGKDQLTVSYRPELG